MSRAASLPLVLVSLLAGCGEALPCGEGTQEVDGACVGDTYVAVSVGDVTEANFPEKAASSQCQFMQACDPVDWLVDPEDRGYEPGSEEGARFPQGDMDACLDAWTDFYAEQQEVLEDQGCELIPSQATACLNKGTCADYADSYAMFNDSHTGSCYEMWDCS